MKITRSQIKRIIKEAGYDSSENLQVIGLDVITNTGPGTDFDMEDILIDIRGLNGVITVNQNSETESLGFNTGMEKRNITAKFDNSAYVDIPTLGADIKGVPGVQRVQILTVDGAPYNKKQAQADYDLARSPESLDWWNKRNAETKIPEYEKKEVRESKMKITKRQLRRIISEVAAADLDLYLDLGDDGDFPTLNDADSYRKWEVPYFTSAADFLDEVLSQLPGSTPDTIVYGEEMNLPDLPLSKVWDAVMAAGRRR